MNSLILLFILLAEEPPVGYNDQVLPILSDKCFGCHGNDRPSKDGHFAIVPGHDLQATTESVMTTVTETRR